MKEKFSQDEWGLLKTLPFLIFYYIAETDQNMGQAEMQVLQREFTDVSWITKGELQMQLYGDIVADGPEAMIEKALIVGIDIETTLREIKDALQEHLDEEQYMEFLTNMLIFGARVSQASGDASAGSMENMSTDELNALADFFNCLGLGLADFAGIIKDMSKAQE